MKPFNLQDALRGDPVVRRDGMQVTEIHHFKTKRDEWELCAISNGGLSCHRLDGTYSIERNNHECDLFMAPRKITKWVNVYKKSDGTYFLTELYDSEKEAHCSRCNAAIITVPISWEE